MPAQAREALVLSGMHRSGTSLAAGWLGRMGVTMHGPNVLGAAIGNERGHYEDEDFRVLHVRAVSDQFFATKGWKVTSARPARFSAQYASQARALVAAREQEGSGLWGWKDPRTILFFDEWLRILPESQWLLVWRPVAEVVDSLVRRGRKARQWDRSMPITPVRAARTWWVYNRHVLAAKRRHPDRVLLVSLRSLLAHSDGVVERMSQRVRTPLSYVPVSDDFDQNLLHAAPRSAGIARAQHQVRAAVARAADMEAQLAAHSDVT